jgi:hypothetical protein
MAWLALMALASGCLERELKPLNPCLVSGVSRKVAVNNVDKVDLLFMIDNSNSMAQEQVSLKAQFPKLIQVLTTGERMPGDPNPFPPVKDLHVGVVSSDMGIPGVNFGAGTGCSPDGGDDGKLQHAPHGAGCDASYPTFLAYSAMMGTSQTKFANDFQCIAQLGTGGCGFEQQLESPLKALWPSIFTDAKGNVVTPNPITFLSTTPAGTLGRGDVPVAQGGNFGFLRNDPITGLSLIAIVVVTDEEDCSARTTEHLKPPSQLAADSPYKNQDINLRCHYNPTLAYDVTNRYLRGFRLLRQGNENLVVFAAITGVPKDLVDKKTLDGFDYSEEGPRNAFFDNILNDPAMQETVDPTTNPGMGTGNLVPSCSRTDSTGLVATAFRDPGQGLRRKRHRAIDLSGRLRSGDGRDHQRDREAARCGLLAPRAGSQERRQRRLQRGLGTAATWQGAGHHADRLRRTAVPDAGHERPCPDQRSRR